MKRPAPEDELEMGVLMARLKRTKVQEAAQAPETVPEAVQAQDWQMQEAAPFPEAVQVRDDQMQEVAPFPEPVRDDADDYEDEWWGGLMYSWAPRQQVWWTWEPQVFWSPTIGWGEW